MTPTIVWGLLGLWWLLDGLRLRGRIAALQPVPLRSSEPIALNEDYRLLLRPGAVVEPAMAQAAIAYARAHNLEVLDLVPQHIDVSRAMMFAAAVDPATFRKNRLAKGHSVAAALVVQVSLIERCGELDMVPKTALEFQRLAIALKLHAAIDADFAIAQFSGVDEPFAERAELVDEIFGGFARPLVALQALLALLGPWFSPMVGGAALVLLHLQPAIALYRTSIRPKRLGREIVLRTFYDLAMALGLFVRAPVPADDPIAARRPIYDALLRDGVDRFFEPRRDSCPLCSGAELKLVLDTQDVYQHKPGRFRLERCRQCGHIFQNPRLSLAGLDFYYRDFYDGLGETLLGGIFGGGTGPYYARADMVKQVASPRRWLDVGAGHGHFCLLARDRLPDTKFDGSDLSAALEEAVRRRWIDVGHRGLLLDLANDLAVAEPRYDALSMSHYLEHTRDPEAELQAAATILSPGGHLLIDVPNPECSFRFLFGRYWTPWFQPQHQHMLSARNLERLLRKHHFEPLQWHYREACLANGFTFAALCVIHWLFPFSDVPWQPPRSRVRIVMSAIAWRLALPVLLLAFVADRLLAPLFRLSSNTFRVLAKKT